MAILRQGQWLAVTTTSAGFTNAMSVGLRYLFSCTTDAYVRVTATGGEATNAANNIAYKAGMLLVLEAPDATNGFVYVEAVDTAGVASLMVIEGDG